MKTGHFGICLVYPVYDENIGGVLRAAYCFGASYIWIVGKKYRGCKTDTVGGIRHIPIFRCLTFDEVVIPYNTIPIAVEITDSSTNLEEAYHPDRALYIFGPEVGSLSQKVLDRCIQVCRIRTKSCLNLAAAVNVVSYDRCNARNEFPA